MDEGGNDSMEGSSGPVPMDPLNSNDSTSVDDLAWADSCLIKLSEASDADWSSFEVSLLELFNGPTEPVSLLTDEDGNFNVADFEDKQPSPSGETIKTPMSTDDGSDFTDDDEDGDDANDDTINKKKKKWLKGQLVLDESPLLPGHAEFLKVESTDSGFDFGSASFEHETTSSQDVFKVWDLGVYDELGEFAKKLNEALEESTAASNSSDPELGLDFTIQSVDDLIAGVSELSLGRSSV